MYRRQQAPDWVVEATIWNAALEGVAKEITHWIVLFGLMLTCLYIGFLFHLGLSVFLRDIGLASLRCSYYNNVKTENT